MRFLVYIYHNLLLSCITDKIPNSFRTIFIPLKKVPGINAIRNCISTSERPYGGQDNKNLNLVVAFTTHTSL